MTYSRTDPTKYPAIFFKLLDVVKEKGEVFVEHPHPRSARGQYQSFLKALETAKHDRADFARTVMVRLSTDGKGILVCDRDKSPLALAVATAVGQTTDQAAKGSADRFMESLEVPARKPADSVDF